MKLIAHLALFTLLPFLSGCLTGGALQAAKRPTTKTFYDSVSKVEKAGVTEDGRLYIFFEKDFTNSTSSRFTLVVPLAEIQTNAQDYGYCTPKIKYVTLNVPGNRIRTNWTLPESSEGNLELVPIETFPLPSGYFTEFSYSHFTLVTNATRTLYLTKTGPIQFVYVDASIMRAFTIVNVNPLVVSKKHPAYYALLPLTVPADIATSPIQGVGLLMLYWWFSHLHC
jgi:hypothetical protein